MGDTKTPDPARWSTRPPLTVSLDCALRTLQESRFGLGSGDENDLARCVAGLELGERRSDVFQRVGALNRND
jgi:hypothetical protein